MPNLVKMGSWHKIKMKHIAMFMIHTAYTVTIFCVYIYIMNQ
jgi:hypothetical protein